jgi:Zn-dependent M28 family amino/carboxypeptidase
MFTTCFYIFINIHSFDHSTVKRNIEFLSSDYFKGRIPGSIENLEVANFIKSQLELNKISPFKENYFQSFNAICPITLDNPPLLYITDKTGVAVKTYKYAEDYKEDMINFKKNSINFNKSDKPFLTETAIQINKEGDFYAIYSPSNDNLNFRSSFISDSSYAMCVTATNKTLSELKEYINKGYSINCSLPFEKKSKELFNIAGCINGKNSSLPPIIISAHFDHIGSDLSGTIYNGALDNASGMCFVLELSKYLKSLGVPERDVIIVAFNAEEFGCIGSKAFVDKYKNSLTGVKVYNFDMIGSDNSVPLGIMGGEKDNDKVTLVKSVSSTCTKQGVDFSYMFEDASDHMYFRKEGIDAVTFSDKDVSRIHTPNDKSTFISTDSIDRCFKVASIEIIKSGYGDNPLLLYFRQILMISFGSSLILIYFYKKIDN